MRIGNICKRVLVCLVLVVPMFQAGRAEAFEEQKYYKAEVLTISNQATGVVGGYEQKTETLGLRILDGGRENEEVQVEHPFQNLNVGDKVVLSEYGDDGEFSVMDKYRLPALWVVFGIFVVLVVIVGRLKGTGALLGLGLSIFVLMQFIIPHIISGESPIIVSILGAFVIATLSLYLAHGFSKRTSIALLGTLITLAIASVIAILVVPFTKLAGMGSEDAMYLQFGQFDTLNLRSLLLGGMIIGVLGILDDVTTGQVAAVDEIHKANLKLKFGELYAKGLSVGREHIASLVNTLVLAYAGASLPLLLLFYSASSEPLWVTLNSEFIVEEIIRTLVGSAALILAVPISTLLAVHFLTSRQRS